MIELVVAGIIVGLMVVLAGRPSRSRATTPRGATTTAAPAPSETKAKWRKMAAAYWQLPMGLAMVLTIAGLAYYFWSGLLQIPEWLITDHTYLETTMIGWGWVIIALVALYVLWALPSRMKTEKKPSLTLKDEQAKRNSILVWGILLAVLALFCVVLLTGVLAFWKPSSVSSTAPPNEVRLEGIGSALPVQVSPLRQSLIVIPQVDWVGSGSRSAIQTVLLKPEEFCEAKRRLGATPNSTRHLYIIQSETASTASRRHRLVISEALQRALANYPTIEVTFRVVASGTLDPPEPVCP